MVQVGYLDRSVAGIAHMHETGAGRLPKRPAFALALEDMKAAVRKEVKRQLSSGRRRAGNYTLNAERVGQVATAALQASYIARSKQLQPVSAQRARAKAGTPGAGRPLIGTKGPKMIRKIGHRRTIV